MEFSNIVYSLSEKMLIRRPLFLQDNTLLLLYFFSERMSTPKSRGATLLLGFYQLVFLTCMEKFQAFTGDFMRIATIVQTLSPPRRGFFIKKREQTEICPLNVWILLSRDEPRREPACH